MTVFSAALLLFVVMDPFGNIPFFISALGNVPEHRRQKVIIREMLIALVVLLFFLFAGRYILGLLHIKTSALQAAGGMVLLLIGIKMVFPELSQPVLPEDHEEPFIVPLAIPYVAGPSAMATLVLIMNQEPEHWMYWLLALLLCWAVSSTILSFSTILARILGKRGLRAIERLMGMVLVAIAVNMILNGIAQFFALQVTP